MDSEVSGLSSEESVESSVKRFLVNEFLLSLCSEISCDFHVDLDDKKVYRTTLCYRIVYAENTCD